VGLSSCAPISLPASSQRHLRLKLAALLQSVNHLYVGRKPIDVFDVRKNFAILLDDGCYNVDGLLACLSGSCAISPSIVA